MVRYVLNSAVLTNEGTYRYRLVTGNEAQTWLRQGPYESRVRWPATADAMKILLNVMFDVNKEPVYMKRGDEALVFRLTFSVKGTGLQLTAEQIAHNCEIGVLTKLE